MIMQIDDVVAVIRAYAPTVVIHHGPGMASGWIEITGSGPANRFTEDERRGLEKLGLRYAPAYAVLSPNEIDAWAGPPRREDSDG